MKLCGCGLKGEMRPSQSIALLHDHRLASVVVGRVKRTDQAELLSVCIARYATVTRQEKINERGSVRQPLFLPENAGARSRTSMPGQEELKKERAIKRIRIV